MRAAGVEVASRRRIDGAGHVAGQQHALSLQSRLGQGDRRQQRLGVGMARRVEQRGLVTDLDDAAQVHHRNPRRDVLDHRQVMGDEQVGDAELALQVLQQVDDLGLHRDIQRRHRLVADDQPRFASQRTRDAYALALAARELVRVALGMLGRQPDGAQQFGHPLRLAPDMQAVQHQRLGQGLAHRHSRVQRRVRVLEDDLQVAPLGAQRASVECGQILAVKANAAGAGCDQPQHQAAQRGLAAARFADHAQRLAGRQREGDAVDRTHRALWSAQQSQQAMAQREMLDQAVDLQQRCHFCPSRGGCVGRSPEGMPAGINTAGSSGAFQQADR